MSSKVTLLIMVLVCGIASVNDASARTFEFLYRSSIGPIEAGKGPVHVFVPLATTDSDQRVLVEEIDASIPGVIETEPEYGNRYWHGSLSRSNGESIEVSIRTTVERSRSLPAFRRSAHNEREEQQVIAKFLKANSRVPVGHPILDPILAEIRQMAGSEDQAVIARAIYDWVVGNVEYKKLGDGWGNGDTFWACSQRYGNCTDFHALFISLARSMGIPARFEIGFPVPSDRRAAEITGYHCWVEFYLPQNSWVPIDASEAFKHPEKRDYFFGGHFEDRIQFSVGRDIRLGEYYKQSPLNYFVYPAVEVAGQAYDGAISNEFSYTDVSVAK